MGGISTDGRDQPATEGVGYGNTTFESTGVSKILHPIDINSAGLVIVAHPNNSGVIYVGWDDSVSVDTGFPLEAGLAVSVDLNVFEQPVYGVADTAGDEVRFLATN